MIHSARVFRAGSELVTGQTRLTGTWRWSDQIDRHVALVRPDWPARKASRPPGFTQSAKRLVPNLWCLESLVTILFYSIFSSSWERLLIKNHSYLFQRWPSSFQTRRPARPGWCCLGSSDGLGFRPHHYSVLRNPHRQSRSRLDVQISSWKTHTTYTARAQKCAPWRLPEATN